MTEDETDLSKEAEVVAQEAVAIITKCLDELRNTDDITAFEPVPFLSHVSNVLQRAHALIDHSDIKAYPVSLESKRQVLVFQIFVPLFEAITCAYQILDRIPEPPVIHGTKPTPPLGMLSLRNYTDVACATECAVVLGILPHLEPNVLLALPERLRYNLPKSLSGRLPRRLLMQSTIISEYDSRITDLDTVAQAIGNLILLDRFQPMLLPRHVTDLYAALLQANHASPTTKRGLTWLIESPVPTLLQAKTFQALLLFGTKGPLWLRQAVSVYLTELAVQDLSAIVQIFVMPDVNSSAAAVRLAKTLQISRRKGVDEEFQYFSSLLLQSLSFLSHLENQEAAKVHTIVHTAWAILDVVPVEHWRRALKLDVTSSVVLTQFQMLFSSIPPSSDPRRVIEWLWQTTGESPSAWCLWWRLAAHSEMMHIPVVEKVKQLLRLVTVAWLQQDNAHLPQKHDSLAIRLFQALLPISWDETKRFCNDQDIIQIIEHGNSTPADLSEMARLIERRTRVMIHTVLKSEDDEVRLLASRFFVLILKLYFSSAGARESSFQLVPLVALPVLCEELSLEPLLSNDDGKGVFDIMKLVFDRMTTYFKGEKNVENDLIFHPEEDRSIQDLKYLGVDISQFSTESSSDESSSEILLSVGSLLLSMLVSILELGAEIRSEADEEILQSFNEPLQIFSRVITDDCDTSSSVMAEIAEMSSHAAALLAARKVSASETNATEMSVDQLAQAEQDLQSSEPPLRARGVVTLRHLASDVNRSKDRAKLFKLLDLTVTALSDKESYVYLAAIYTVAAIADISPSIVIPVIGKAVASGILNKENLSEEQRIKLAEALISIIRRKAAMEEYSSFLMECMLWCSPGNSIKSFSDVKTIQQQTHEYLSGTRDEEEEEDISSEEQSVRLKTGGPLFQTEERDALRASFLQVVAELWGFLRSDDYTSTVMEACRIAISLEAGRPVRRAGALLARQMYSRLLERGDLDEARSMAAANEEGLHASLLRCYTLKDLGDLETKRLYDPATEARCREALDLRQEASELLNAGKVAWSVQIQEDTNPIIHLSREKSTAKKIPSQFLIKEIN